MDEVNTEVQWLVAKQVADVIGCATTTVYRNREKWKLKTERTGGVKRFYGKYSRESVLEFIKKKSSQQ